MVAKITTNKEAGFVSLFTVIFFTLMMTVITVGFLRVMGIEQQQALNNDLTASAIAAAESGIEDGKRAILAYHTTTDPNVRSDLAAAFSSDDCNALIDSPAAGPLGLNPVITGEAVGSQNLNEFYTCLDVDLDSPDYINRQDAGTSDYIPLVAVGGQFQEVQVSWHLISQTPGPDGDGTPSNYAPGPLLLPFVESGGSNSWSGQGYPAYLRVQLYGHPNGAFTRTDLEARSRTLMLIPSQSGTNAFSFNDDIRGYEQSKAVLKQVDCVDNPGSNLGAYACTATISLPAGLSSADNSFYLRVTPVYGPSHFRLVLRNGGAPVEMSGVQPIIDATGRTADVYRRLQARVRLNPVGDLPEFVVQSAETICKNMEVADGSYHRLNDCD